MWFSTPQLTRNRIHCSNDGLFLQFLCQIGLLYASNLLFIFDISLDSNNIKILNDNLSQDSVIALEMSFFEKLLLFQWCL